MIKLQVPLYDAVLPSGIKITFRPFTVKEEKVLLIAQHSDDAQMMITSVKQVLQNCLEASPSVNVDDLPLFDVEYLFLQLRARSIGEIVTLRYRCNKLVEANTVCGVISEYPINLLEINPKFGEGHNKTISLTTTEGVIMKYPSFDSFKKIAREDLAPTDAYQIILDCIDAVYDGKGVYYSKDIPKEELGAFVDSLSPLQVKKIDQFFDTMPKIATTVKFECPKCGSKEDIHIEGLDSFFV